MTRAGRGSVARAIAAASLALLATGCAGGGAALAGVGGQTALEGFRDTGHGRPRLAAVTREGDARGALAASVSTAGIAPDRGAVVGVALEALVEARWQARGATEASGVGGWDGMRIHVLADSVASAAGLVEGLHEAMLTPVAAGEPALAAVGRRVDALARRPLADRALVDVAACTGEAFGTGADAVPAVAELEGWRAAAFGVERVALATAGSDALADAVAAALQRGPAWPSTPGPHAAASGGGGRAVVYDASGQIAPGAARVVVTARTGSAEQTAFAAPILGDARGPLSSRLAALDAPATLKSVVATAHVDGGCVATTLDLEARDLGATATARIATAAALARQEIAVELTDAGAPPDLGQSLASQAADPRDAADRASWWALARHRAGGGADTDLVSTAILVGVASPRDAAAPMGPGAAELLRGEIDRATIAWHAPAVEARTRVERGQGELWILVASPCGTAGEDSGDAGAGAAVATAAASTAGAVAGEARVEPFVASDGIGLLVHGGPRPGESPGALARRLADLAARSLLADPFGPGMLARARTALLAQSDALEPRALGALGEGLAPGHPSWIEPLGTAFGLASASDEGIATLASALRAGPLRVAVVANAGPPQAEAAARAVDRWVARRAGEARACPAIDALVPARPGTYAVPSPAGATSEAILAIALPPADETARSLAEWTAAALDGPDGLLARALGEPSASTGRDAPLARGWSASVIGTRAPALAIRVSADDATLDAAVAQTRALLDRLRQGALRDEDRARAGAAIARATLASSLDPRARTIALWRGAPAPEAPPSLDALRAFAAGALHDDALVLVAARPPRPELHPSSAARTRSQGHPH